MRAVYKICGQIYQQIAGHFSTTYICKFIKNYQPPKLCRFTPSNVFIYKELLNQNFFYFKHNQANLYFGIHNIMPIIGWFIYFTEVIKFNLGFL